MPRRLLRLLTAERGPELAALCTVIASLLTGVLIARSLGPGGRGQVVIIATWGQALAWAGGLSIDKALMARNKADGRRHTQMPLAAGLSLLAIVGITAAALSAAGAAQILRAPWLCAALGCVVLGTVAVDARAAHLLCHDRWREYSLLRLAQPVTYLLGCLGARALIRWQPELSVALFVGALCVSLWAPALLVGGLPRLRISLPRRRDLRAVVTFAGAYHAGSVLAFLTSRIDLMAVSVLFGTTEVGVYSVAATLGQITAIFGSASLLRGITGKPTSAGVDVGGLVAAGFMTLVIAASGPWLVERIYGTGYADAGKLGTILCIGGLFFYLRQGLNGQLTGLGHPWMTAWANGAGVTSFLGLLVFADTPPRIAAASVASVALSTAVSFGLLRWHSRRPTDPGTLEDSAGHGALTGVSR